MKKLDQIKALAELDGFQLHHKWDYYYRNGDVDGKSTEDSKEWGQFEYFTSYDAIIPLIQKQDRSTRMKMFDGCMMCATIMATPAQLCVALLRATGKWVE